jgi:hypothetical protein
MRVGTAERPLGAVHVPPLLQEHAEVEGRRGMTALVCSLERLLGIGQPVALNQQHGNLKRAVGVAALIGSDICSNRTIDVPPLLQKNAELGGGASVTQLVRMRQRPFGLLLLVLTKEQQRELERRVSHAALNGAAIRRRSTVHVAAIRQEHSEIVSGSGVTVLIGMRKPLFGLGQLTLVNESLAEVERGFGGFRPRGRHRVSQRSCRSCECRPSLRDRGRAASARMAPWQIHILAAPSDLIERPLLFKS